MPREPWQRIPGDAMEQLLREECEASPLVSARYGWTVLNVSEQDDAAETSVTSAEGKAAKIITRFVVGCDGANSVVRKRLDIPLDGGPLYVSSPLIGLSHYLT
jgi:FAD-dependent monooxygenase